MVTVATSAMKKSPLTFVGMTLLVLSTYLTLSQQASLPQEKGDEDYESPLDNSTQASIEGTSTAPPQRVEEFVSIDYDFPSKDPAQEPARVAEPVAPPSPGDDVLPEPPKQHNESSCYHELKGERGLVTSDKFPENYAENSNCTWNISVPEGKRVRLTFYLANIEYHNTCMWDWVKVIEQNGTVLKQFCGYLQHDLEVISTNNTVKVQLYSDSVIQGAGFLASWEAVPAAPDKAPNDDGDDAAKQGKGKPGYILSFPQSFSLGSSDSPEETLCLQLINVKDAGKAEVSMFSSENLVSGQPSVVKEVAFEAAGESPDRLQCFNMQLPQDFRKSVAVLKVKGSFGDYTFLSYKTVKVLRSSTLVLIQTDKGDYRPGQEVRMRLLFLDSELKPSKRIRTLEEVYISDPSGNRVKQWKNVTLNKGGLAQLSMKLEKEPQLGTWQITATFRREEGPSSSSGGDQESESAEFTVSEAVLPKFEVKIEGPDHIVKGLPANRNNGTKDNFRVCATYTHGAKLKRGSVNITFYTSYIENYWGAPAQTLAFTKLVNSSSDDDDDGCVESSLNETELELLGQKSNELNIQAIYREEGTGTEQNASRTSTLHSTPFRLDFEGSSTSHMVTGAFPYVGTLRAVGHNGLTDPSYAGLKVEVCARLFTSLEDMRNYINSNSHLFYSYDEDQFFELSQKISEIRKAKVCQILTTGPDGSVDFSVDILGSSALLPANVTKLSFKALALDDDQQVNENRTNLEAPSAKHDVSLSHAKQDPKTAESSFSALTIHDLHGSGLVACNRTNEMDIYFSARRGSKASLTWYFSSGGSIVQEGSTLIELSDQQEDLTSEYLGNATSIRLPTNVDGKEDLPEQPASRIIAKHTIGLDLPLPSHINQKVSSIMKMLVYLRDDEGNNILTAHKVYKVQPCDIAPPKVSWSTEEARPGSPVTMTLTSGSDNDDDVCAYSVVDRSVDLVRNPNKITKPRLQDIKEDLANKRIVVGNSDNDHNNVPNKEPSCRNGDLFKAFELQGLFVLSDQVLQEDTKCSHTSLVIVEEEDRSGGILPFPVPQQQFAMSFQEDIQAVNFAANGAPLTTTTSNDLLPGPPPQVSKLEAGNKEVADFAAESQGPQGSNAEVVDPSSVVSLRNYFPETWLFDMEETGGLTLNLTTPHTITTWVADAYCIGKANGLRVSNTANLLVTQDFFADLSLPYSVKRGEHFPLNASIFNNKATTTNLSLPMVLTVLDAPDGEYLVDDDPEGPVRKECLTSGDNVVKTFKVTPKVLDEVNITVEARISSSEVPDCTSSSLLSKDSDGFKDTIRKSVVVKPEGFPVEKVQNEFVCLKKSDAPTKVEMGLGSPVVDQEMVAGSVRAWVSVTGDIMAPSLANLEKLVQQPTGCGEQNMMGMVPNIYLLKYLASKGVANLTAEARDLEEVARRYMKVGYERQQKYRFEDGSYSVWGPSTDKVGSLWLTSFVVRAFAQASPYIPISSDNVWQSVRWILDRMAQKDDKNAGAECFAPSGYVIHDELMGDDGAMTASVLIALLEVEANYEHLKVAVKRSLIDKAFKCLQKQASNSTSKNASKEASIYQKALVAYATNLYQKKLYPPTKDDDDSNKEEATPLLLSGEDLVEELLGAANSSKPGMLFWTTNKDNLARDVETTAYAVLSLVMQGKMAEALKAIKWLASNRNSLGGFVSTQDTMVALHAISDYSVAVRSEATDLQVTAQVNNGGAEGFQTPLVFKVDKDNELLLQKEQIAGPGIAADGCSLVGKSIALEATGSGCFIAQTVVRFNVKTSPELEDFVLNATQSQEDNVLSICAGYKGSADKTDMVVMEVELLSGFEAYRQSLDNLKKLKKSGQEADLNNDIDQGEDVIGQVKKYEYDEKRGHIVLYFDQIPKEERCYNIKLKRAVKVEELKPAIVKIYDYYNPKSVYSTSYNLS